ncbi:MAG TPA: trypsin-like peptidase domain-containing protein [Vicinamibacterales bacterium]|nr:trypsin-like peptidase domain-containing protein [Vicinamibacterales bacterium]
MPDASMTNMLKRLVLALIFVSCGVAAGLVLAGRMRSADEAVATAPTPAAPRSTVATPASSQPAAPAVAANLPDFSGVAARAVNAVTNIASETVVATPNSPWASDPFFQYFFGDREDVFGYRNRIESSLGSGVVVSADGYILTNSHVVGSLNAQITTTFADKREVRAKIIGVDELTDIALIKVDARDLPTLPWGDSSKLKVADWVLAIGNPYSLSQTVTLGIVSAMRRSLGGQVAGYEDFIQTDAAINPGNSGGALVNARGELVGINTAIFSRSGGYQGIGFAVPSNLARRVMDSLMKYGEVRRGSLGRLDLVPLTTQLAEELGAPDTRGAVIYQMRRSSSAYAAGLRPGDIIVRFNGQEISDPSTFVRLLADAPIGSTVKVGIIRNGERREVTAKVSAQSSRRQGQ